jgi:hypothetical protein
MRLPRIPLVTFTTANGLTAPTEGAIYCGFVRRIPRDQAIPDWGVTSSELDCLIGPKQLSNVLMEALPGVPLERVATVDCDTGDILLLYRGAFRKKVEP